MERIYLEFCVLFEIGLGWVRYGSAAKGVCPQSRDLRGGKEKQIFANCPLAFHMVVAAVVVVCARCCCYVCASTHTNTHTQRSNKKLKNKSLEIGSSYIA